MSGTPKHVAVLVFPFTSHTLPMLTLVRRISAYSPTTVFSFFGTKKSNGENFPKDKNMGSENIRPCCVDDGLPEGFVPSGNPLEPVQLFLKVVPGNFSEAIRAAEQAVGLKISCLITDALYWFGADMAREMGIPWVPVWTSGPWALLAHIHTDLIRKTIGSEGFQDKTLEFIPGFESFRALDLPQEITELDPKNQFSVMIHKAARTLSQATAVAVNSLEELNDPIIVSQLESQLQNKFLNVGPLTLLNPSTASLDRHGCIPWLDDQKPASVVYISFGSVITPSPPELTALSEALEEAGVPFLWSFRGNPEEQLPRDFVSRARESSRSKIVPWAPQLDVLRHESVGAFLTQGGWHSVLESFMGGVPMILKTFFADQQMNSRTVEAMWRVGIRLEGGPITRSGTVAALKRVLFYEEGMEMRGRIGRLKELVLRAMATGGSSIKNFESLVKIVTG